MSGRLWGADTGRSRHTCAIAQHNAQGLLRPKTGNVIRTLLTLHTQTVTALTGPIVYWSSLVCFEFDLLDVTWHPS